MPKVFYEFEGTLQVLSPLHVGSGDTRTVEAVKGGLDGEKPAVAAIVRDALGRPYIPGSTLKGALRRIAERLTANGTLDKPSISQLFGEIKEGAGGQIGAILFRGATLKDTPPDTSPMPYGASPDLGKGVFVAARTQVEHSSGVADDHALFFQEMVAADTCFTFRLVLGRDAALAGAQAQVLVQILAGLTAEDGVGLGKGQADGQGRVQLKDLKIKVRELETTGAFKSTDDSQLWSKRPATAGGKFSPHWELKLHCPTPFIIVDSSWAPPKVRENEPQLKAQRVRQNLPLILGSSITGALRARARWLASLDACASGQPCSAGDVDREKHVFKPGQTLTPVERLFGVTGFRALLEVRQIKVNAATPDNVTSVKLDGFSGGPIDSALFASAIFIDTSLSLRLVLARHGAPADADRDFAERLIRDICDNGLELGHGMGKGFGWFKVEE